MDSFSIFNSPFSIVKDRLKGEGIVHLACPKNKRLLVGPEMIILHYTAGSSASGTAYYLTRPDVGASAHLVIGRDGQVIQLVAFNVQAWHAGKSWYEGRGGLNHCSVGIELDNLGQLRLKGGKFMAECGVAVPFEEVFVDDSGEEKTYWHRYTDVQVEVLEKMCELLVDCYPIRDIVGHSDVTSRKVDPGPALELCDWIKYY